ncbi:MAG: hypothetical protein JWM63_1282 [Gammaproteobacteria bacterium]|nr:hypothetical protein [Gammaproteobacteria bacterium]
MGTAASSAPVVNCETVLNRRVSSAEWRSAAFGGIVAKKRDTLFLQSRFAFACGDRHSPGQKRPVTRAGQISRGRTQRRSESERSGPGDRDTVEGTGLSPTLRSK